MHLCVGVWVCVCVYAEKRLEGGWGWWLHLCVMRARVHLAKRVCACLLCYMSHPPTNPPRRTHI